MTIREYITMLEDFADKWGEHADVVKLNKNYTFTEATTPYAVMHNSAVAVCVDDNRN